MNRSTATDDTKTRSLVEAAAWRSHLAETDAETSEAFESWRAADPRNEAAWKQVQEPWKIFGEHAAAPEIIELRRAALAEARSMGRRRWIRTYRFGMKSKFAIAAAILGVVASGLLFWHSKQPEVYRTASGERRVVTLRDGSQIALDSRSEVQVRYTDTTRDLTLSRGQARFDVAHDVERPFSVIAGGQKVVATGTVFNVDLLGSNVLVTLIEGHVVVLSQAPGGANREAAGPNTPDQMSSSGNLSGGGAPSTPLSRIRSVSQSGRGIELVAGEQLVVTPVSSPSIERVNIDRTTAWQNGQLIFENEPLSSVIARVNRYADRRIDLVDVPTGELRISGVFHTGDVNGFVSTITSYLPVRANQGENGSIRLSHR
jgi:transmembrane sensor